MFFWPNPVKRCSRLGIKNGSKLPLPSRGNAIRTIRHSVSTVRRLAPLCSLIAPPGFGSPPGRSPRCRFISAPIARSITAYWNDRNRSCTSVGVIEPFAR